MMGRAFGIDLGTTFSAVAVMRPEGRPALLMNVEGETLTPSVVLFTDGDQVLVGSTAKRATAALPSDCAQFFKRHMGDPHWRFVDSRGREYRAEQVAALILRRIAEDAGGQLGEPVKDVVITVPAYFDDARRLATRDAGEIAGLRVLRLINEPTAAAIAFGLEPTVKGIIFVYDLGGGTFDVTIMRAGSGEFEVIATDGDRNLGGFDFDNALMRHVSQRVQAEGGPDLLDDPVVSADLRDKCELAKRQLTTVDRASVFVGAGGRSFRVDITRDEFDAMTHDLLYRTEVTAGGVLDDAGLAWADIDHVLLVGGSTRMRQVRDMIERISGKKPAAGVNPDEAVALGAAVVAENASAEVSGSRALVRVSVRDVTSQSLGVVAVDGDSGLLRNSVIIPRNTRIPVKQDQIYYTVEHHQRVAEVQVTECGEAGDETDLAYATVLGAKPIPLPHGRPKDSPLRVVMAYDVDGVIHVELIDLTDNRSLGEFELERPNNLDRRQIDRMRTELASKEMR